MLFPFCGVKALKTFELRTKTNRSCLLKFNIITRRNFPLFYPVIVMAVTFTYCLFLFCFIQDRKERGLAAMRELLRQKTYMGALSKINSPLNPSFKLRQLKYVYLISSLTQECSITVFRTNSFTHFEL